MKVIYQEIESCNQCPHKDHTGAFTKGGAKPCCDHPETVKLKGNDFFKRVIPYKIDYLGGKKWNHIDYKKITKKIPKWCPLPDKGVTKTYRTIHLH